MNEIKLIALFFYICECYDKHLQWICQRFSQNSSKPDFWDEEILTIYLYCVLEEEKFKVKSIYTYADKYLRSWFPKLPSYQAYNHRLNRLAPVFPVLVNALLHQVERQNIDLSVSILDSMPIVTCSSKRTGKVARELTDKGYCSTKKMHYYGVKLHSIAFHCRGTLPMPEFLGLTPASVHDLSAVRHLLPQLVRRKLFGDKIYWDRKLDRSLWQNCSSSIYTPVKYVRAQCETLKKFDKAADDLYSTAVSKIRQPIESFFNWLIEKTDIQRASKVRSANGLIVHVFGKIAAAIASWIF